MLRFSLEIVGMNGLLRISALGYQRFDTFAETRNLLSFARVHLPCPFLEIG